MKRRFLPLLSILLVLLLTACGTSADEPDPGTTQIANPWTDCETLDEAVALAGFDITVPDSIDGYDAPIYRVMPEKMLEIIYYSGNNEIRIRKAPTESNGDDISGDCNSYTDTYPSDCLDATILGAQDSACKAIWTSGEFSYSVTADPGISLGTMQHIIASVK